MRTDMVLTFSGPDRVGVVEEVSQVLLDAGGNIGTSRMARLGGEFAILTLVSLPEERARNLEEAFAGLREQGYRVTITRTHEPEVDRSGWRPYRIDVRGADHEGIIHDVASGLARRGISIESAETGTSRAPVSGTPLFAMCAVVAVPPGLPEDEWREELADAARQANVDITVTAEQEHQLG